MWIRAAVTLSLFSIALHAQPGELPREPFSATVEAVTGGDAVRVVTEDGDTLAALYGISSHGQSPETREAATEFVRGRTDGSVVTVEVVTEVAGMPFVEVVLPSGDVLNHLLLMEGLAGVDRLTAGDDPDLAAMAEAARETPPAPEPVEAPADPPVETTTPQPGQATAAIEAFHEQRAMRETAELEAARDKWLAMPDEYREQVRMEYEQALDATAARGGSEQAALEAERLQLQQSLEAPQPGVAPGVGQEPGAVEAPAETPGTPLPPPARQEQAEALRQAEARLQAARTAANTRTGRLAAALARFDQFEEDLEHGRVTPELPPRRIVEHEASTAAESIPFAVDSPVMRIDWDADADQDAAHMAATVYEAASDRPIARFRSTEAPHESFLILDGDDEFYIRTETAGPVSYRIEVFEIGGE